jgi:hypothetical protein
VLSLSTVHKRGVDLDMKGGIMDVVKDNIARLLKKVFTAVRPDLLFKVAAALESMTVKSTVDARTVFSLLLSMCQNRRIESHDIVFECLSIGWNILLAEEEGLLVLSSMCPDNEQKAHDNFFSWIVLAADESWHVRSSAGSDGCGIFVTKYAQQCLRNIEEGSYLPQALSTFHKLIRGSLERAVQVLSIS